MSVASAGPVRRRTPASARLGARIGAACARQLGCPRLAPSPGARRGSAFSSSFVSRPSDASRGPPGAARRGRVKTARPASVGVDEDDPAVVVVVAALDEAALLHPVDDPGRARDRHVERVGELAHRQRALVLEDRQHVEVDDAERALQPAAGTCPSARAGFQASARRRSRGASRRAG